MNEEATAGLNPHDEQRARSMADEGGVSAAVVEAEEDRLPAGLPSKALLACAAAAACGAAAALWWFRRW